eukprot:XP_013991453.1 PREDICTED: junctophilin-2-like isoform X1 [Salmo salar]
MLNNSPEYMKKRALQEISDGNENTGPIMHEPLLAGQPPTPAESPMLHDRPGSSPARTPSPSPAVTPPASRHSKQGNFSKEDPHLLGPAGWNGDKGSRGSSRPNSRTNSRPTTPASAAAPLEERLATAPIPSSRASSRLSNKVEQGSDLEIKPLEKTASEAKVSKAAPSISTSVAYSEEEKEAPPPASKVSSKAAITPEPKSSEPKQRTESVNERPVSTISESEPESSAQSVNKVSPKPSPSLRPLTKQEASPASKPATPAPTPVPKAAKPAPKVEPKAEAKLMKNMVKSPSEVTEVVEFEQGPNTIMITMVILLNIGLAILFVHILS